MCETRWINVRAGATFRGRPSMINERSTRSTKNTLEDYMYWQRDPTNDKCWTKVYGILDRQFFRIYKYNDCIRPPIVQVAVSSVQDSGATNTDREIQITDPNGEDMQIWLLDNEAYHIWRHHLKAACQLTTTVLKSVNFDFKKLEHKSSYRGSLVKYRKPTISARFRNYVGKIIHPPFSTAYKRNSNSDIRSMSGFTMSLDDDEEE